LISLDGIRLWFKELFLLAMKVALPYFGILLLTEIGLGFIAKLIPQMNIFILGFPVKILLGLVFLAILSVAVIRYLMPLELDRFIEMLPLFWSHR
jgi:flagellar biosynthetic protein FliR